MIATLRSGFALVAAVQFLDTVERAVVGDSRPNLDRGLKQVMLMAQKNSALGDVPGQNPFRVSHWLAPALAFDAPCGAKVRANIRECSKLPLDLEVEPVITYGADELASGEQLEFRRCLVEVLDCRHRPSEFTEGAGGLGVAYVRIRISPLFLDDDGSPAAGPIRIWGEQEVEKLSVKEVRVYVWQFVRYLLLEDGTSSLESFSSAAFAITLPTPLCVFVRAESS
jgi:hypothetical protein